MTQFDYVTKYYTYTEFVQLMEVLVAEGRNTGMAQSADYTFYTKLNLSRFQRLDKTVVLPEDAVKIAQNAKSMKWWIITESWCGDGAQSMPVMQKIAEASGGKIDIRIILRDEHTEIIDQYLTNGGRAIPKLIAIDTETDAEIFQWGPRPAFAQKMMMDWRADKQGKSLEEIEKELHGWYNKDKGESVLGEFLALLNKADSGMGL